jgi:hypothetical protein
VLVNFEKKGEEMGRSAAFWLKKLARDLDEPVAPEQIARIQLIGD